jgi:L-asparaginase
MASSSPRAADRPRVAFVFTGGSIESVGRDRLDLAWYIENGQRLSNQEVLDRVPELAAVAEVYDVPFRKLPSHALTDADWLELLGTVQSILAGGGVAGVVIVHGTNTLEETAHFLHLTLKSDRPVVLVGSMRPPSGLSPDGDLNLLNAAAVASAPEAAGLGVLVVMNNSVLSARDATKVSTYRVQAFQGRDEGQLGVADSDGRVVVNHRPARPHTTATEFDVSGRTSLPRVDVVVSYVGADGVFVDAAVAAGAEGIVSAATGAGRPTPAEDAALQRAAEKGVVVCISSRVSGGRVVRSPLLQSRGFVTSENLPPWKARTLLSLALTMTREPDRIQTMFERY